MLQYANKEVKQINQMWEAFPKYWSSNSWTKHFITIPIHLQSWLQCINSNWIHHFPSIWCDGNRLPKNYKLFALVHLYDFCTLKCQNIIISTFHEEDERHRRLILPSRIHLLRACCRSTPPVRDTRCMSTTAGYNLERGREGAFDFLFRFNPDRTDSSAPKSDWRASRCLAGSARAPRQSQTRSVCIASVRTHCLQHREKTKSSPSS